MELIKNWISDYYTKYWNDFWSQIGSMQDDMYDLMALVCGAGVLMMIMGRKKWGNKLCFGSIILVLLGKVVFFNAG